MAKRGRPKKHPAVSITIPQVDKDVYQVDIYCTNCNRPQAFTIDKGKTVGSLTNEICTHCGCEMLEDHMKHLPYKVCG